MLRAAALAVAAFAAFIGVMYVRFSGDTVPPPEPTPSGPFGPTSVPFREAASASEQISMAERCNHYARVPKPPQCEAVAGFLPTVPPTPPTDPIPRMLAGMTIVPLEIGEPFDLPMDLALIVETGCWGCEGGPSSLVRVYVRPDGSIASDSLLDPSALGLPMRQYAEQDGTIREYPPPITGYAITPDASEIVASLCINGTCTGEGLSAWSAYSQTVLVRSTDGGVTWTEVATLEVGASVLGLLSDRQVVLITYDSRESSVIRLYPGLSEVTALPSDQYWLSDVLPNGELIWRDNNGVPVLSDGRPLISALAGTDLRPVDDLLIQPEQMHGLASVYSFSPGSPGKYYLVPFDDAGAIGRGAFAPAGENVVWITDFVRFGVDLTKDGLILGNAAVPTSEIASNGQPIITDFVPVAIDLKKGSMRPFRPFLEGVVPRSRNLVAAAQRGPFARVVNTEGTCLNVRSAPNTGAKVLDCAAEGVLLRTDGSTGGHGTDLFLHVFTPSGIEGWASTQYLEH